MELVVEPFFPKYFQLGQSSRQYLEFLVYIPEASTQKAAEHVFSLAGVTNVFVRADVLLH